MKNILLNYVIRNKRNFIIIIILFMIGIFIGTIFINNSNSNQKVEINNYIEEVVKKVKESETIDKTNLLLISIKQNIIDILLIWFLGCTVIGGIFIYIAVIYKGFSIGYTISALIAVLGIKQGALISITSLLLQNIIFLPAFYSP